MPLQTTATRGKYGGMSNNNFAGCLLALTPFCVVVLAGLYAYTGTYLPSTGAASAAEEVLIWAMWGVLVAVPAMALAVVIANLLRR